MSFRNFPERFSSGAGRVLANSAVSWARIVGGTLATLLTTRFLLQALGIEAFGVYATINSFALLTGFLTTAMQSTTLRAVSLADTGPEEPVRLFNALLGMHMWIALGILIIGGTGGIWIVEHVLHVPKSLQQSARTAYLFILLAAAFGSFLAPYEAFLQSKERFGVFAFLDLMRAWLLLPVSVWLMSYNGDRLEVYALFAAGLSMTSFIFGAVVSWRDYPDTRPRPRYFCDRSSYRTQSQIFIWTLFGSLASVARNQGLMILVNVIGGATASAAFAIGNQFQTALRRLSTSISVVLIPRIYGKEARGERHQMIGATFASCKLSALVAFGIAVPLVAEMSTVLDLWLGHYDPSVIFVATLLITSLLIDQTSAATGTAHMALGRIARYQLIAGGLSLLFIPVGYIFGRLSGNFIDILVVMVSFTGLVAVTRVILLEPQVPGATRRWFMETLVRLGAATVPPVAIAIVVVHLMEPSSGRLILNLGVTGTVFLACTLSFGLLPEERLHLQGLINRKVSAG